MGDSSVVMIGAEAGSPRETVMGLHDSNGVNSVDPGPVRAPSVAR